MKGNIVDQANINPTNFTECVACHTLIAKTSESCPKCGAVNEWTHPKIHEFRNLTSIWTPRPFIYFTNRTHVWGNSAEVQPLIGALVTCLVTIAFIFLLFGVISIVLVYAMNAAAILSLILGPLAGFLYYRAKRQPEKSFQADLEKNVWYSNDDEYWGHVKKALGF